MSTQIIFETFRGIDAYTRGGLTETEPTCWNGCVAIRKYRVTIEEIDNSIEAMQERLLKLWANCDNHHQWEPMQEAGKKIGLELNVSDAGSARRKDTKP